MDASSQSLPCVGIMSGTSLDGADGVLAQVGQRADGALHIRQCAFASAPFAPALRAQLLALNTSGPDELHRAAQASHALMRVYADVVGELLRQSGIPATQVAIIGAHGQTVRHHPPPCADAPYTLQLCNGALLAQHTGIAVACDFRSRDIAAGGQGAPLAPAFHQALWGHTHEPLAVLNLGGIANVSLIAPGQSARGFDCGPANLLLDHWCQMHTGHPFDADGQWAAQGRICPPLLERLLTEPFFAQSPPKSTGRDLFNPRWLAAQLRGFEALDAADVQATLAACTAQAVAQHVLRHAPEMRRIVVCGGGAQNRHLMGLIAQALPHAQVQSTAALGLHPQAVEAAAFAWLGFLALHRRAPALRAITGAQADAPAGCIYPASSGAGHGPQQAFTQCGCAAQPHEQQRALRAFMSHPATVCPQPFALPFHGGADARGAATWDFSTNANAAGPCPHTQAALARADATRYPDPAYTALRESLAAWHGVEPERILIAASASEWIVRATAWAAAQGARTVWLPALHYGDYAHAAAQHGLQRMHDAAQAQLLWLCAPSSPLGQAQDLPPGWAQRSARSLAVLDCAYAPLQLGDAQLTPGLEKNTLWQLYTPNKALGLCGIRAAYAIAPQGCPAQTLRALVQRAPSWPLGAHGAALLQSWCSAPTQQWLSQSLQQLRAWKAQQIEMLQNRNWQLLPSQAHFMVARPAMPAGMSLEALLQGLRARGVQLRDCASFGLSGHVRLCVHTPPAQAALQRALREIGA